MAANEIAERLAAACWVRFGSVGGEAVNALDPSEVGYRSRVGFTNRIITTLDGTTAPLFILPLDRTMSRTECAVFAQRIATVGPNDVSRLAYPLLFTPPADHANVAAEPILLAWLGDDLTNPTYMPFGLLPGPTDVPAGHSLDLFDAIAILLPLDGAALSGDVCVMVWEHAKPEGADEPIEAALPADVPFDPVTLDPLFWWRMDDYTEVADEVVSFNPRSASGDEGDLTLSVPVAAPLPTDPVGNDQQTFGDAACSLEPVGFTAGIFDALGSDEWSVYIVCSPVDDGNQRLMNSNAVPPFEYQIFSDPPSDELVFELDSYLATPTPGVITGWQGELGTLQILTIKVDVAGLPQIEGGTPQLGTYEAAFGGPAPGTATEPAFNSVTEGGAVVNYFEIIGFARVLSPADEALLVQYFIDRYNSL